MPITSLYFPRSLRRPLPHVARDHAQREHAAALFDEGRLIDAVDAALSYLLMPGGPRPDLAREPLCLVQGSARLRLHIDGERLLASAGLIRLTENSNTVAALRYLLGDVGSTGQLHQPRLRGDVVTLEFDERLTLLHPLKLIEAVQLLADEASNNDVWLQERFDVAMHDREPPEPLDDAEFDVACEIWDAHWAATEALVDEVRRRRSTELLNRVGAYARNQPEDVLPLQGELYKWIDDAERSYADRDLAPGKRLDTLGKHVREARSLSHADLRRGLGHARYSINPLQEGSPSLLAQVLGGERRAQMLGELDGSGRSLESALFRAADLQYLLAYHTWPERVEQALRTALHGVSGRPLREAVEFMDAHTNTIINGYADQGIGSDEERL